MLIIVEMSSDSQPKKLLAPLNLTGEPTFVNAKQYERIIKRRRAREKQKAVWRKKVESRSKLASSRVRTYGGKFMRMRGDDDEQSA